MSNSNGYSLEFPIQIPGPLVFEHAFKNGHKHMNDTLPHIVSHIENKPGLGVDPLKFIRHVDFAPGLPFTHLTMVTDILDEQSNEYKFTVIEGGKVGTKLVSATYSFKLIPTENGGWACKITAQMIPLPGIQLTKEEIDEEKQFFISCVKAFEDYILANPGAF